MAHGGGNNHAETYNGVGQSGEDGVVSIRFQLE